MSTAELTNSLGALKQFTRSRRPVEACELCGTQLPEEHTHLVDPKAHKLVCACGACALLFSAQQGTKYKRVSRRIRYLTDFHLTDAQWEGLMIPINMAFFFQSSTDARIMALYPSPAGATESQLALDTWNDLAEENPELRAMEPDVEALLVNRLGPSRGYAGNEYYLLPIDECYKVVWLIRKHWKGLSGGADVWHHLGDFFAGLRARSEAPRA